MHSQKNVQITVTTGLSSKFRKGFVIAPHTR